MNLSLILDDCLARLHSGESIEACVAHYPEHAQELEPLLAAAAQLRGLAEARLTQGQRLAAKVALREALAEERPPRALVMWRWARALPVAMFLAAVLFVAVTGAAVAGSQPGDLAYPLRVVVERAPILVRFSTAGRAAEEVDIAARRLSDVREYLMRGGAVHPAALNELLAQDAAALRRAARLSPEDRRAILDAVAGHADQLSSLVGLTNDVDAQARLQAAAAQILAVSQRLVADSGPDGEPKSLVVTPTPTPTPVELLLVASPTRTQTSMPAVVASPVPTSTPRPTRTQAPPPAVVQTRPARPPVVVPTTTPVVPRITLPARATMTVAVPRPTRDRDTATLRPRRPTMTVRPPTVAIPTVTVPTVVIPTIEVPTVVIPTVAIPTVQLPTIARPTRVSTLPVPATVAATVTSSISDALTSTPTPASFHTPVPTVVVPTVVVPTLVEPTVVVQTAVVPTVVVPTLDPPTMTVPATVTLPPPVETLIVMTLVPPPPVQTVIMMTLVPPTASALPPGAPVVNHAPGAVQPSVASGRPAETAAQRPRGRP